MHANRSEMSAAKRGVDPFFLHKVERMKQKYMTVQTMKQTFHGTLALVHADYIVLHVHTIPLYIQLHDIVRIIQGTSHIRPADVI